MILVWNGGEFVRAKGISAADRGLLLGDGLFETIRVEDGAPRRLSRHMRRLASSARALDLPVPVSAEAVKAGILSLTGEAGLWAARLTVTRGPGGRGLDLPEPLEPAALLSAAPYQGQGTPARLVISDVTRSVRAVSSRHKTLSYIDNVEARRRARALGADDAVMLNGLGDIACASAANIFWIAGGRLYTPALSCGALAGITRACVMRQAGALKIPVEAGRFSAAAVQSAEAAFLTNALTGVRPVAGIGGRSLNAGHPMLVKLKTAEAKAGG